MSTGVYNGLGVVLRYPENWTRSEETRDGKIAGVQLDSPSGAFLSVTKWEVKHPLEAVIEQAEEAMRAEYADLEAENADMEIGESSLAGIRLRFYCLDLLINSQFVAFYRDDETFLVQFQAEDREYDRLEMVFKAILHSMIMDDPAKTSDSTT